MTSSAGYHEVLYDEGDQYKGDWNTNAEREGFGVLTFADGSRYSGKFVAGLCEGPGVLTFPDKSKYEGEFARGKYNGHGVFQRADGMKYEGEFYDGMIKGMGLLTFADGTNGRPRQEGEWDGTRLVRRAKADEHVRQAQDASVKAKASIRK